MFHIFSFYYMNVSVGSFHIFKPFWVPREEAAILWKVSSKNLSPVTKPQHLRGVKTNPIKFSVGLAGGTRLSSIQSAAMQLPGEGTQNYLLPAPGVGMFAATASHQRTLFTSSLQSTRTDGLCVPCLNKTPSSASNNPQPVIEKLQQNMQMEDPRVTAEEATLTWLTESQWKFWGIS